MTIITESGVVFNGDEREDFVQVLANAVTVYGAGGDDWLSSSVFESVPEGEQIWVRSDLVGGAGDDFLYGVLGFEGGGAGRGMGAFNGGAGDDLVDLNLFVQDGEALSRLDGEDGNDVLNLRVDAGERGAAGSVSLALNGGVGNDHLSLRANSDALIDGVFHGNKGRDTISAKLADASGTVQLFGDAGADRLSVRGGDGNKLNGGAGDDRLTGGDGSDQLAGGYGEDLLRGNGGADVFRLGWIRENEHDSIADFRIGEDQFDLSSIDANVFQEGNQSFTYGGAEGTGRVWIEQSSDTQDSIFYVDTGRKILEVIIINEDFVQTNNYSSEDFIL